MQYASIIILFSMYGTLFLYGQESSFRQVLEKVGEKKKVTKYASSKKINRKESSRFIFIDTYDSNEIGSKDKNKREDKKNSKSYTYENKSRFRFRFNNGLQQSNIMGGNRGASLGGRSGGMGGHGKGGRH